MNIDMKDSWISAGEKIIGSGSDVFVIAEIGINHNGSVTQARKMIDAAAACGADAVKFQSFRADKLVIPSRDRYSQQIDGTESAYQMLRRLELGFPDQERLKKHADNCGILFISTPFDNESVDFLDSLDVPLFKIASGDITHVPLLRHVASKGKPVFLSTGMSFLSEVGDALWHLRSAGAQQILLMHCVSAYPAALQDMNLRALQTLQSYFELPVGLSDHSQGMLSSLVAVAFGARVIEKHFTLDKNDTGPDHKASLDPDDLKLLIQQLRQVEVSIGDGRKKPAEVEEEGRMLGRRSIVAAADIRTGEAIENWMLTCKRPGTGLEPKYWDRVIGMAARRNIEKDTILQWEDLAPLASSLECIDANNFKRDERDGQTYPKNRHA
jgi:N-acetylneuraminate synthase/N,N'-diacetyllegionaminate synthase